MRTIVQYLALGFVVGAVFKAFEQNSIGWSTVAICVMIFLAASSISDEVARGLDGLDDIKAGLKQSGLLQESEDDDVNGV